MSHLAFSVIIPAYNGADYIGEAIDSVLAQSYPHFEIIVVNDVSTDNTADVVRAYDDPRLRYIEHETNQGADIARKTALDASTGDLIAFLDQDDAFHPDKLAVHAKHYAEAPETGLTYNARYDFVGNITEIREIWRPPDAITLIDLCAGFPFAPSDTVLRRDWAMREEIWDQSTVSAGDEIIVNGTEIIFCGRLFLAGCLFASVPGVLNYRRYHPARHFSDLDLRCRSELLCQQTIFDDPRCSDTARSHEGQAYVNTYLIWSFYAYAQGETDWGKTYLSEAMALRPELIQGDPSELTEFMMQNSCNDSRPHDQLLTTIFEHLPDECAPITGQKAAAIGRGYLLAGIRAMQWGRTTEARVLLNEAVNRNVEPTTAFHEKVVHQLLQIESERGAEAMQSILDNLMPYLSQLGSREQVRFFKSCYAVNRAYQHFHAGNYSAVPGDVLRATANDMGKLMDRGVLSILLRSLPRMYMRKATAV